MKKLLTALTVLLGFSISVTVHATDFETATQAVANMKIGWNLGNTLDSHDSSDKIGTDWRYCEGYWSEPPTTPKLMKMMKNAGFNVIRVPVTWYTFMDANGKVSDAWMQRVHEVVDYVINEGMYCLLNVHHDTGATANAWVKADYNDYLTKKTKFEYLWRQIAEEFKDYDEKLLFEGYNEMLDIYNSWNFASYKANVSQYDAAVAASAYQAVNAYAQSFVNAVRSTGGNNLHRNLVCNIYCCCEGLGSRWNEHLQDPGKEMVMPTDIDDNKIDYETKLQTTNQTITTSKHLAVQMHYYRELEDLNKALTNVDALMTNLNILLADRLGVPVIIGEWGPRYTTDADKALYSYLERDDLLSFANYFVTKAKENGFVTMYWMGMSNKLARLWPYFNQPKLAKKVLKAYYGEAYEPVIPKFEDYDYDYTVVTFTKLWNEFYLRSGDTQLDFNDYSGVRVVLAEAPKQNGTLQLRAYDGDKTYNNRYDFTTSDLDITLNFDITKTNGIMNRIALVNKKDGELVVKVKHAYLIMSDNTQIELTEFARHGSSYFSDIVAHLKNGPAAIEPVALSENDGIANTALVADKPATFTRTFTKDKASTICLPFYISCDQAMAAGKFYTFAGVNDAKTEVTMVETKCNTVPLVANMPYLFMPAADGEVTFSGEVPAVVTPRTKTIGDWTFTGTYNEIRWDDTHNTGEIGTIYGYASGQGYEGTAASVSAGEFVRLRTGGIKPFRAYMKYVAPTTNAPKRAGDVDGLPERMTVRLVGTDGTTTAIGTIDTRTGDVSFDTQWFTFDGMRLSNKPSAKGIYIRSDVGRQQGRQSKKVVIK